MSEMKNCVTCGATSVMGTGHIHTRMGTIGAGHCQEHHHSKGTGQILGCDSPNPDSCYGWREIEDVELYDPISPDDEYIATVNGSMQIVKRSQYATTDEAIARGGVRKTLWQRLFA